MNTLDFLINEPYLTLGLCIQVVSLGIMGACLWKFQRTNQLFGTLQRQWVYAESNHHKLMSEARDRVQSLSQETVEPVAHQPHARLATETRNHVVTLSRKGVRAEDIARACGISQSAVGVILGFARLQEARRK